MKSLGVALLITLISTTTVLGQESGDYDYGSEFIWGVTKASNSGLIGGLIFKYSRAATKTSYHTFGLEMVNIKHPKEARYYSFTGNTFIWGKQNYLYSVRLNYGRDWILFRKAPQQGVQINGNLSAGPSIGLQAPYYIEYEGRGREQFNPAVHDFNYILGTGNIFQGIEDSEIKIGANVKASLSFEFGTFKTNVVGFETGFMMEAFANQVVIMPNAENRALYPNAFITLYYGSRK
jgi:hypothetical protein